jgi:hypothetical protein
MSCSHSEGRVCDSCAPFIYGAKGTPLISTPYLYYTPENTPSYTLPPKAASTDYIEGALTERKRIVEALKNAGHADLAGKIDRGEL